MPAKRKGSEPPTKTAKPEKAEGVFCLSLSIDDRTLKASAPTTGDALEKVMKGFTEEFIPLGQAIFALTHEGLKSDHLMFPFAFRRLMVNSDARLLFAQTLTEALQ